MVDENRNNREVSMPGKDQFLEIIGKHKALVFPDETLPTNVFTVLWGIEVSVWKLDNNGFREDDLAIIYSDRGGTPKGNPFQTTANGRISFFADNGEYEIVIVDTEIPERIISEVWHWSSVPGGYNGISKAQLPGGGNSIAQPGDIKLAGYISIGQADPDGWLFCDGRLLNKTSFEDLYDVIGDEFNIGGELSTQFRLPDLRGKAIVGPNNLGTARGNIPATFTSEIGENGGAYLHSHGFTTPTHSHTIVGIDHNHGISLDIPPHSGQYAIDGITPFTPTGSPSMGYSSYSTYADLTGAIGDPGSKLVADRYHYHDLFGYTGGSDRDLESSTNGQSVSTGTSNQSSTLQPYQCLASLIKI